MQFVLYNGCKTVVVVVVVIVVVVILSNIRLWYTTEEHT